MSSRERKVTGMHPGLDPDLTSAHIQNPDAITPVNEEIIDVGNKDTTSRGTEGQHARKEVRDLFGKVEAPIKNIVHGHRERFMAIIAASFERVEQKVKRVLKIQCEQRQKMYEGYSLEIMNLNEKLTMDADQVRKQTETLCNMFKEHRKFILDSLILQKNRMEEFKALCEQYLEKFEILRDSRGNAVAEELRCLLATLEVKLQMVNHQQESAAAQEPLLDLLLA